MAQQTFSGFTHMLLNFRERVVSDDFNRAQQFAAYMLADMLRRGLLVSAAEDEAEGKTTHTTATTNPLKAIVFEGLRVRPEIGTVNLFVESGSLLAVFPDADPHPADSPARLVHDAGVQTVGTLVLTPNGGGGTRIDIVECQPRETVTEADNRDKFDPATGLFAPVLMNKVARGELSYRIRSGTPGGGFASVGTASGWLPLAVCSVPAGASTWDDATLWDVRPLLADVARPPHLVAALWPRAERMHGSAIDQGGGQWHARGLLESELSGWKVGGDLAPTQSGATSMRLDSSGSPNIQEPGFAAVASTPWYLYLAHPHGLPRWAKYSPASSGERTPQSPRGVPVFTQKAPAGLSGKAGSAISLPTATGLGGTTTNAKVMLAGAYISGPTFRGVALSDGHFYLRASGIAVSAASGVGTNTVTYNLVGNTSYPANAIEIEVQALTTITDAGGTVYPVSRQVTVLDALGNTYTTWNDTITSTVPAGGSFTDTWNFKVQVPPNLPTGAAQTFQITVFWSTNGVGSPTYSGQQIFVKGWRLA